MSDSTSYYLRWRGRQSGPCTLKEINRKLDEHEIGMGHEVQYQDRWVSVEEFLRSVNSTTKAVPLAGQPSPATALVKPAGAAMPVSTGAAPPTSAPSPRITPSWESAVSLESMEVSPRRRWIFAALAILLGFSGMHNFYARHWLTGVIQLLVSVASSLLGFGVIAPWLWAMVEAVVVRKDGNEMELS